MQVIAEDPWNWFLFEDEGLLYLDVLVENGAVSFSVTAELAPEQAGHFRRTGVASLAPVAHEMRRKGLMRTWRITPDAGSFHRTRAMRLAACGVPSQTITTPACCE